MNKENLERAYRMYLRNNGKLVSTKAIITCIANHGSYYSGHLDHFFSQKTEFDDFLYVSFSDICDTEYICTESVANELIKYLKHSNYKWKKYSICKSLEIKNIPNVDISTIGITEIGKRYIKYLINRDDDIYFEEISKVRNSKIKNKLNSSIARGIMKPSKRNSRVPDEWKNNTRCKNMNSLTKSESVLYGCLDELGIDHCPQYPITVKNKLYYADTFVYSNNTVIEMDGGYHDGRNQKLLDSIRDDDINRLGYTVVRFKNHEIEDIPTFKKKLLAATTYNFSNV